MEHAAPGLLLVDNDERILELCVWYLAERGFEVRSATSFAAAREILRDWRPALLLSDIDLGGEDAREELPLLAAAGLLPPTLVVSGYLDAEVVAQLDRIEQVVGTLSKPFDFAALEERVRATLALAPPTAARSGESDLPARPAAAAPQSAAPAPCAGPGEQIEPSVGAASDDDDDDGWVEITPRLPGVTGSTGDPGSSAELPR